MRPMSEIEGAAGLQVQGLARGGRDGGEEEEGGRGVLMG